MSFISKIYYINLEKRTDRNHFMSEQLSQYNVEFERFNAILVEKSDVIGDYCKYKKITERFLKNHEYNTIYENDENFQRYRGSISAYISFYLLIKKLLKDNVKENILILQDDCIIRPNFFDVLEKFILNKHLPSDFDILRSIIQQKRRCRVAKINKNHRLSGKKGRKITSKFDGAHFNYINGQSIGKIYDYLNNSNVYQIDGLLWTTDLEIYEAKFKNTVDLLNDKSDCDPKYLH